MQNQQNFVAIDLGASGCVCVNGYFGADEIIHHVEVARFSNGAALNQGYFAWNRDGILKNMLYGLRTAGERMGRPESIALDSWGVDFALVGHHRRLTLPLISYRDRRTNDIAPAVNAVMSPEEVYSITGIAAQQFNTLPQLVATKRDKPDALRWTAKLLFLPDYFHYLMTGKMCWEYTEASTSQLLDAKARTWSTAVLDRFEIPRELFGEISFPGENVGTLLPEISEQTGFDTRVTLVGSHDTASAVVGAPIVDTDGTIFLSSGTWSLMGTEIDAPICTPQACEAGFTNEGGTFGKYRFLKNIMGLWMLQRVKREFEQCADDRGTIMTYDFIVDEARRANIDSIVDCNDSAYFSPLVMRDVIAKECAETGQQVPSTIGEFTKVILRSLALCYANSVKQIEAICGIKAKRIHIFGGGSKNIYLNQLTADATGLEIIAGPTEASAIGNIATQMITAGIFRDVTEARAAIARSTELKHFFPQN